MNRTLFSQTGHLVRFCLRRDWLRLTLWIVTLALLMTAGAAKFEGIYGTAREIKAIVATLKSPAMVALFGALPLRSHVTTAQVFACEMLIFMAIFQIIMNFSLAIRSTRGEEDSGLTEMISARAVGRLAPLMATAIELFLANALIGIIYASGLTISGMPGAGWNGNWLIGMSLALNGFLFACLALVSAQIMDHASAATGLAYLLFGVTYLIRMVTDVRDSSFTWWSPLGWIEKTQPYVTNNWMPVLYSTLLALVFLSIAMCGNLHRDIGAGAWATRPGRSTASPLLRGSISLLVRLEGKIITGWLLAAFALGTMYGSIFNTIGNILKTNPTMQEVFGKAAVSSANHSIILHFLSLLTVVFAVVASIPAIQVMNKLKSDEAKGWLEALYAKPLARTKQYLTYGLTGIVTGAFVYLTGLGGTIIAGNSVIHSHTERITAFEFWQAYWGMLPAIFVMLAIAAVFVGWLPRFSSLNWIYLSYGFIALYMGGLLKMTQWMRRIAPFGWVPSVPVHHANWTTFWWMTGLTIVLILFGLIGYWRRDLEMG